MSRGLTPDGLSGPRTLADHLEATHAELTSVCLEAAQLGLETSDLWRWWAEVLDLMRRRAGVPPYTEPELGIGPDAIRSLRPPYLPPS